MSVDIDQKLARSEHLQPIKDGRDQARKVERQADRDGEDPTVSLPLWRSVVELGRRALDEQAKDLEIAAFMIEALVRTDGFAGLREGFQLAHELVVRSWDELAPMPDEDGMATRVLPLARLNGIDSEGILIAPITRVPITQGRNAGPYCYWHWQQTNEFSGYSERERQSREERKEVTPERFRQAVKETDTPFFQNLISELTGCRDEFAALCQALDEKCGRDESGHSLTPPSSSIQAALEDCLRVVQSIAKDRLPAVSTAGAQAESDSGAADASSPAASGQNGRLQSREDAFRMLEAAADFLEHAEPQSLLPAQIRKVVRWGRLPPAQYYEQLLQDSAVIENLFKLVGIEKPESSSSNE